MSAEVFVLCSVPQSSVLGPRLFVLSTADLTDVVAGHNVKFHGYADDSQMSVHSQRHNTVSTISRLGHCVADIGHWMAANRLQMNPTKTELLWAGSKHNITMLGSRAPAMRLGLDIVTASDHVRVLGVTFSSDLTLEKHVSKTCAAGFYWLRQLRRIRRSLDENRQQLLCMLS